MFASHRLGLAVVCGTLIVAPVAALADYAPITSRSEFVNVISNKDLTRLGISVSVKPDGKIEGSALGWDVTGSWKWSDGYFCRQMEWGGDDIGYNCQAVSVKGNKVKFQSDKGTGQHAVLTMR